MSSQLPGAPQTLAVETIADATTAERVALSDHCTSITIHVPADATWCAIEFGDGTVVATKATARQVVPGGFVLDEARPVNSTHVSVLTGGVAELYVLQRRP